MPQCVVNHSGRHFLLHGAIVQREDITLAELRYGFDSLWLHQFDSSRRKLAGRTGVAMAFESRQIEAWYNGIMLGSDPKDGSSILSASANFSKFFDVAEDTDMVIPIV
jgi:hypothetical protein